MTKIFSVAIILLLYLVFLPALSLACLWDSDTLAMERHRFPSVLEMITGKFIRHSNAYYEWRIRDRQEKLRQHPQDLLLQDDLAVAYDKTGNHKQAIEIARRQLEPHPKRYETLANLGTFYIHDGAFKQGLKYIDMALEVNPDAHFGRERYQKHLVEYLMSGSYRKRFTESFRSEYEFVEYLKGRGVIGENSSRADVDKAIKGILGMMRFGNAESPVLLDALAGLLRQGGTAEDASQLAARAYLRAAALSEDRKQKEVYHTNAEEAILNHGGLRLSTVEERFKAELREASDWYQTLERNERKWISDGVDVDAAFQQQYYREPYDLFSLQGFWEDISHKLKKHYPVILSIPALFAVFFRPRTKDFGLIAQCRELYKSNVTLKRAFWYYLPVGMFVSFLWAMVLSLLLYSWEGEAKIVVMIAGTVLLPLYWTRLVWKSASDSHPFWRITSRSIAPVALCITLYTYMEIIIDSSSLHY